MISEAGNGSRQVLAPSEVAAAGPRENPAGPEAPECGPRSAPLVDDGMTQWLRPLGLRHAEQRREVKSERSFYWGGHGARTSP